MTEKEIKQRFALAAALYLIYANSRTGEEMDSKESAENALFHYGNIAVQKKITKPAPAVNVFKVFAEDLYKEDGENFAINALNALNTDMQHLDGVCRKCGENITLTDTIFGMPVCTECKSVFDEVAINSSDEKYERFVEYVSFFSKWAMFKETIKSL